MHCASAGPPVTLNGVVSDGFCQKLIVRQVPSRGAGPGAGRRHQHVVLRHRSAPFPPASAAARAAPGRSRCRCTARPAARGPGNRRRNRRGGCAAPPRGSRKLAFGDGDLDGVIVRRRPDAHVLERRAERAKHGIGLFERGSHLRRDGSVVLVQMPRRCRSAGPGCRRSAPRGNPGSRRSALAGSFGIVAGDGLQHDRAVLDGPRHRAGMVEGEGIGVDAGAADEAVGRLQPDDAAERGRAADRAAGIGAERAGHKPGGDRGARRRSTSRR